MDCSPFEEGIDIPVPTAPLWGINVSGDANDEVKNEKVDETE